MISNKEIITFANWYIGAANKSNWHNKSIEFRRFLENWEYEIEIIIVDSELTAQHVILSTIPYYDSNKYKAVGVYTSPRVNENKRQVTVADITHPRDCGY